MGKNSDESLLKYYPKKQYAEFDAQKVLIFSEIKYPVNGSEQLQVFQPQESYRIKKLNSNKSCDLLCKLVY